MKTELFKKNGKLKKTYVNILKELYAKAYKHKNDLILKTAKWYRGDSGYVYVYDRTTIIETLLDQAQATYTQVYEGPKADWYIRLPTEQYKILRRYYNDKTD